MNHLKLNLLSYLSLRAAVPRQFYSRSFRQWASEQGFTTPASTLQHSYRISGWSTASWFPVLELWLYPQYSLVSLHFIVIYFLLCSARHQTTLGHRSSTCWTVLNRFFGFNCCGKQICIVFWTSNSNFW